MDRKNLIIAVLVALLVLGSLWGQVGQKNAKMLRQQLAEAQQELSSIEQVSNQNQDEVLGKTAKLQKILQGKEKKLTRARKELVELRKANKGLEAKISEQDAALQKLTAQLKAASQKVEAPAPAAPAPAVAETTGTDCAGLEKSLKEKDRQLAMTVSAGKVQIADLQKKIIALKKQAAGNCPEAAEQQAVQEESEVVAALQNEVTVLKARLAESTAQASDGGAGQVKALQAELAAQKKLLAETKAAAAARIAALQKHPACPKAAPVAAPTPCKPCTGAAKPIQMAALRKEVKECRQQLLALEKKNVESGKAAITSSTKSTPPCTKPFVRGGEPAAPAAILLDNSRLAELQAALEKKDEQLARARRSAAADVAELKERIAELEEQLKKQGDASREVAEQVITQLQKNLTALRAELKQKDDLLVKAQKGWKEHLADLQVKFAAMRDELAAKNAKLAELTGLLRQQAENNAVTGQNQGADIAALQEKLAQMQQQLAQAESRNQELSAALEAVQQQAAGASDNSDELAAARAQILGLEKMVEEKSAAVQEIGKNLERVKVNMDVLLNKISDQQNTLQEVQATNRELVRELAAKNEEIAALQANRKEAQ